MAAHGPGRGTTRITTLYIGGLTTLGITAHRGVGAGDGTIRTGPDGDGDPDGVMHHRGGGQEPFAPTVLQAINAPDIRDPQQAPVHTVPDTELIVPATTAQAHIAPATTTVRLAPAQAHIAQVTTTVRLAPAQALTAPADAAITVIPAPLTVEAVQAIRAVPEEDIRAAVRAEEEAEADIDILPLISPRATASHPKHFKLTL